MTRYIYFFGGGKADGNGKMKEVLGGKGAGLAEMTNAGIPVPPGFTISTEVCRLFYANRQKSPKWLDAECKKHLAHVEKLVGLRLGDAEAPLLVSVRSGARDSMPGMMDTILNLGLNDQTVLGLAKRTGNERFAWDSYRRFISMFASVVYDMEKKGFERKIEERKLIKGVKNDTGLGAADLKGLVGDFKALVREKAGKDFPQDPYIQLREARDAVFASWMNERAKTYRRIYAIPDHLGTACSVVAMVFGNMGEDSGTGVGFTRNPATGEKKFYGEYLSNAQGEDVVAGIRTPKQIDQLKDDQPAVYDQLREITSRLEKHYRDVQDFEFTIQQGTLYMLQTRNGKRTGHAAVRIACDMVREKLITPRDAVMRVLPDQLEQLLHPIFDATKRKEHPVIAKGLDASPGAAAGKVVFHADDAVAWTNRGDRVLLVRGETCPDDIHGMAAAKGVLTAIGGATSHATVVGRQMGKPTVVGCSAIKVDEVARLFRVGDRVVKEGDFLSIDGSTGEVMLGDVPTRASEVVQVLHGELKPEQSAGFQDFATLLTWADKYRRLKVRANADIPRDAEAAIAFGAQGIGLCRTEHMFFAEERLPIVVEMIMADTEAKRRAALDKLLPFQRNDFKGLFATMRGKPVTIRTLDPPLHEFLPKREELMVEIAVLKATNGDAGKLAEKEKILARVTELHEFNPMLGHRGCRLGITYPEITEMQARAIFEAAIDVAASGRPTEPEVMIPLVGNVKEFTHQKAIVVRVAEEVMAKAGRRLKYTVGTMIEVPRAAVTADRIAEEAEFFSFGTNDLTQMGSGFSRDDSGKFMGAYIDLKIYAKDVFQSLDVEGIGELIRIAVSRGRATKEHLKIGICGEHGGDPDSIAFCHRVGLDYVSCSPFRVPVARLAAARVAIADEDAGRKPAVPKAKKSARAKASANVPARRAKAGLRGRPVGARR